MAKKKAGRPKLGKTTVKRVLISMEPKLLRSLDKAVKERSTTRSALIASGVRLVIDQQ